MKFGLKRESELSVTHTQDFPAKLRNLIDEKIRHRRNGIDLNMDKRGMHPFVVYRNFEMSEAVFQLGCDIHAQNQKLDFRYWAHWMINTQFYVKDDCVSILCRDKFFADLIEEYLGSIIREYFKKQLLIGVSQRIKNQVENLI